MKKITIKEGQCIGCGACIGITSSEVFDFNDEGYACVKEQNYDNLNEEMKEATVDAKEGCPTEAIEIEEI